MANNEFTKQRMCPTCSCLFEISAKHPKAKFCSRKCSVASQCNDVGMAVSGRYIVTNTCWLWTRSLNSRGYGIVYIAGKHVRAHRAMWELAHGPIPQGLHVLHHCDTPSCVNPAHLFLGTHQDNMIDKVAKGRHNMPHGERNHRSKLTEAFVKEIRASTERSEVLAQRFSVTRQAIHWVRIRKNWAHVT